MADHPNGTKRLPEMPQRLSRVWPTPQMLGNAKLSSTLTLQLIPCCLLLVCMSAAEAVVVNVTARRRDHDECLHLLREDGLQSVQAAAASQTAQAHAGDAVPAVEKSKSGSVVEMLLHHFGRFVWTSPQSGTFVFLCLSSYG